MKAVDEAQKIVKDEEAFIATVSNVTVFVNFFTRNT